MKKCLLQSIMIYSGIIFLSLLKNSLHPQNYKEAYAKRIFTSPKIDGNLSEKQWDSASVITDFIQYDPIYNGKPSQKTEVYILYDNTAIFIGAKMYDTSPDSIYRQLGERDQASSLNADYFAIKFDTYDNLNDAYIFIVSSSDIQSEYRMQDYTYDAVWESKTKITDWGWVAEIKIPYSALRFPVKETQTWRLQIVRSIRRNREFDIWALEEKGSENVIKYWGKLKGIEKVDPPLRLSFMPYISFAIENQPNINSTNRNETSYKYTGGIDLKYGINESFTLDMILLPDFSDVKSDNIIKNLSAFETYYDEKRSFFNEATDLFKLNNLFYSRRIGGTPLLFNNVINLLPDKAQLLDNPSTSPIINAIKISGKTQRGTSLGFLNAITGKTYANYLDSSGYIHKLLTNPLTNYNITVFNQVFKNNSTFHIINTNVTREGDYRDANVSGGGFNIYSKNNIFRISSTLNVSQIIEKTKENKTGYNYSIFLGKVSGRLKYNIHRTVYNKDYDINDLGIIQIKNIATSGIGASYNFYEPVGYIKDMQHRLWFYYTDIISLAKPTDVKIGYNFYCTLKNYLSIWTGLSYVPTNCYDIWEPRINGEYYITHKSLSYYLGTSSDYRKKLSIDFNIEYTYVRKNNTHYKGFSIAPIYRINNHLQMTYRFSSDNNLNDMGYATKVILNNKPRAIFGKRNINYFENSIDCRYIIKNDLSLNATIRHYWAIGKYATLYLLENGYLKNIYEEPLLTANGTLFNPSDYNFNFNTFNIDFSFNWQFMPGSNLSIIWKNSLIKESDKITNNFINNLKDLLMEQKTNFIGIKATFYVDYLYLKKRK